MEYLTHIINTFTVQDSTSSLDDFMNKGSIGALTEPKQLFTEKYVDSYGLLEQTTFTPVYTSHTQLTLLRDILDILVIV